MSKKSVWQRVRRIWVISGILATIGFFGWSWLAYQSTVDASTVLASDGKVVVSDVNGVLRFSAAGQTKTVTVGMVFFPGAGVEPIAYAPLARAVATVGYPVILVPMPKRGMFGGADAPELLHTAVGAMHDDERAYKWVIGGHSRGAVVATKLVSQLRGLGAGTVAGLLLIGTSHPRDVDFSKLNVPVTKIYGSKDGLASEEEVEANRKLLPPSTTWVRVKGGNHSQFGWYGFQPGDRFASISREAQHEQMITAVIATLRNAGDVIDQRGFGAPRAMRADSTRSH